MGEYSKNIWDIISQPSYIAIDNYCDVPEHIVYHYTSPEGFLNILHGSNNNTNLWFTRYDSLNDTSERKDIFEYLCDYCERKVLKKEISQSFAEKIIKSFQLHDYIFVTLPYDDLANFEEDNKMVKMVSVPCDTYLCCFSKQPDLLPMWNYYSKSQHYEGYSIGFMSSMFASSLSFEKGYSIELKRVLYTNKEKDEVLDKIILPFNKLYLESIYDREDILQIIQDKISELQFVFKKECFKHEEEIRAILHIPKEELTEGEKFVVKYRNSHGYIVSYIEYSICKDAVDEVYIAPLLQTDLALKNISEMLKKCGYDNVYVKPSSIPIRF